MSIGRLGLVLLLISTVGCQAMYRYRSVAIEAVDAETGRPIAGAEIAVTYPLTPATTTPTPSEAPTGADGIAYVRAAPCGDSGVKVTASASNYLPGEKYLSVQSLEEIPAAGLFETKEPRKPVLVVEMYAGPTPTVELVLPNNYRGLVRADIHFSAETAGVPGQRHFTYEVGDTGLVQMWGPHLLSRVLPAAFHARYADGTVLSIGAQGNEVGFWWLSHEEGYDYFLVGTRSQYDASRASDNHNSDGDHPSGGGGHGGGRGHHGQGGPAGGGGNANAPGPVQ
jgi:hypothetical protein